MSLRKLIGIGVLMAVAIAAGSVICLAAGRAVTPDCNGGMQNTSVCPFMTVSIPAVPASSANREVVALFVIVLASVLVLGGIARRDDRKEANAFLKLHTRDSRPPDSFLNTVIQLIASGILHARVFGF